MAPSYLLLSTRSYADCFTLTTTYACSQLSFKLAFLWNMPERQPIILCDDEDFDPCLSEIEAYVNWNPRRPDIVADLIVSLLKQYTEHQLGLCRKDDRISMEVQSLEDSREHFEVMVSQAAFDNTEYLFVFRLNFPEILLLPTVYTDSSDNQLVVLKVRYSNNTGSAELCLPDFISKIFSSRCSISLPPFQSLLLDYVEEIKKLLPNSLIAVRDAFQFRKTFFGKCRQMLGYETCDGDFVYWTRCSFHVQFETCDYILNVRVLSNMSTKPQIEVHALSLNEPKREVLESDKEVWKLGKVNALDMDDLVQHFASFVETFSRKIQGES